MLGEVDRKGFPTPLCPIETLLQSGVYFWSWDEDSCLLYLVTGPEVKEVNILYSGRFGSIPLISLTPRVYIHLDSTKRVVDTL